MRVSVKEINSQLSSEGINTLCEEGIRRCASTFERDRDSPRFLDLLMYEDSIEVSSKTERFLDKMLNKALEDRLISQLQFNHLKEMVKLKLRQESESEERQETEETEETEETKEKRLEFIPSREAMEAMDYLVENSRYIDANVSVLNILEMEVKRFLETNTCLKQVRKNECFWYYIRDLEDLKMLKDKIAEIKEIENAFGSLSNDVKGAVGRECDPPILHLIINLRHKDSSRKLYFKEEKR